MLNTNLALKLTDSIPAKPELLPLALGACWRYLYFYSGYYSGRAFGTARIQRWGTFDLRVVEEAVEEDTRRYAVETRTEIKCENSYSEDSSAQDSARKLSNKIVTSRTRNLVFDGEALWYDNGSKLEYMMPGAFIPGGRVNLKLFNVSGNNDYSGGLDLYGALSGPGARKSDQYIYYNRLAGPWLKEQMAVFSSENKGLTSLTSHAKIGGDSAMSTDTSLELVEYTPGAPTA
jgi:hypothetical protein